MLEDVNQALDLDLWSNIHHIKEMVYLIIRKAFQSNLPRIHGLGYVDFLLSNLEKFQGCYSGSLASVINQLQIIQKELENAQLFLENVVEQQQNKHNKFQHWAMLLIGKAYEVEYVVDACIRKELPSALMMNEEIVGFEDVMEELRDTK